MSYGGENGFNQAIELAADSLQDVKFLQEKKLISAFFSEIAQDTGKYVYGVANTLSGLEQGAVEKLICWENLDITRYTLKKSTGEIIYKNLRSDQEKDKSNFVDEVSSFSDPYVRYYCRLGLILRLNRRSHYLNGWQTSTKTSELC